MNADKFFEKYSIEEISKRTKISPISLRFIRNKEFEKIPRAKFFGFIKIIENEFKVDLSDLKEEYSNTTHNVEKKHEIKIEKEKNYHLITILALIMLIIGGYILYKNLKTKTSPSQKENLVADTNLDINEINTSIENTTTYEENVSTEENITYAYNPPIQKETNQTKPLIQQYKVDIIPNEKVWFRAINIDTNKTYEFLTSKEKILPKGNYYIKFGHGNITIYYNNQTITPNTKKIIRILFKDGNYTYLKKPNRYEK